VQDESFDIPRSCLLPEKVEGLIMGAGRSANTKIIAELRVMGHTMVVGQGAGVTAAVAARNGTTPGSVSYDLVQDVLKQQSAL
jgi:ABC-type anion transport system duplicated permease subunit